MAVWVSRRGTWGGSAWSVCEKGGQAALHMGLEARGSTVFHERWDSGPWAQLWAWREWMDPEVTSAAQPCGGGPSKQQEANTEWCVRSGGRIALYVDDKFVGLKSKRLQWKMIE